MIVKKSKLLYLIKKYSEVRFADRGLFFKKREGIDPLTIPGVIGYFENFHVQGFVVEENNERYIFLLGSNQPIDWFYNFWFRFMRTPYKETGTSEKIKVHRGFYRSYLRVRDYVHEYAKGQKKLTVFGASLGAALATLASLDIQYNFPRIDVTCINTASPRVGNSCFVDSFNRRVPNTMRFVNGADLVTKVPFKLLGFRHVSKETGLNRRKGLSIKDHLVCSYIESIEKFYTE